MADPGGKRDGSTDPSVPNPDWSVLVSLGELALEGNGHIPIVVTTPATTVLSPRQRPPNRVNVYPGGSDYWTQVKRNDMNTLLSIGTPITSEMAFLTMFSEWGTIEGGRQTGNGEYSSEQLYGIRRYPDLVARQKAGYFDCSTYPEQLIFDFLWLDTGKYLADSTEPTIPFVGRWTCAESNEVVQSDACGDLERCPSGTEKRSRCRIDLP